MYSWVYIGVPLSCETTMGECDRGCMGMGSGFRDFTPNNGASERTMEHNNWGKI